MSIRWAPLIYPKLAYLERIGWTDEPPNFFSTDGDEGVRPYNRWACDEPTKKIVFRKLGMNWSGRWAPPCSLNSGPMRVRWGFDEGYTLPTNALRSKLFGVTIAYARPVPNLMRKTLSRPAWESFQSAAQKSTCLMVWCRNKHFFV